MKTPDLFLVAEKRCPQCLFSPKKIVSDAREADILANCEADGSYFVCHKGSMTGNDQLCCRGFYDQAETLVVVLAKALDRVRFVPVPSTDGPLLKREN